MAKRGFFAKTERRVVGAAKSTAARVQAVAIKAATAAATAAAQAAVQSVMASLLREASKARTAVAGAQPTRRKRRKVAATKAAATRKAGRKRRI